MSRFVVATTIEHGLTQELREAVRTAIPALQHDNDRAVVSFQ